MKRVFQMAMKDLRLLSRDKIGMFFMLGFPILMGIFFGFVMGGMGESKPKSMKVAIIDDDQSEISAKFIQSMEEVEMLDVRKLDRETASNGVRRGELLAMIGIPEGFGETAGIMWEQPPELELGLDPSRSAESAMLEGMIMQSAGSLISDRFSDPESMRGLIEKSKQQIADSEDISPLMRPVLDTMMNSASNMFDALGNMQEVDGGDGAGSSMAGMQLANIKRVDVTREPQKGSAGEPLGNIKKGWDISFPQSMVWGILGCVAGFATLTVRERTLGTLTRLHVAPIPRWQILAGKGLGCFIAVLSVIMLMMCVGYGLGMRPQSWPLLCLAAVCSAFCFVGIMMLLSLLGKTEQATSGAAWGACSVMAMFGGGMIPAAFMPGFMKTLSNYDPVKWAVVSVEGAIWRDFSLQEMMLPCGILIAVGLVTLVLGSSLVSRRMA